MHELIYPGMWWQDPVTQQEVLVIPVVLCSIHDHEGREYVRPCVVLSNARFTGVADVT